MVYPSMEKERELSCYKLRRLRHLCLDPRAGKEREASAIQLIVCFVRLSVTKNACNGCTVSIGCTASPAVVLVYWAVQTGLKTDESGNG